MNFVHLELFLPFFQVFASVSVPCAYSNYKMASPVRSPVIPRERSQWEFVLFLRNLESVLNQVRVKFFLKRGSRL